MTTHHHPGPPRVDLELVPHSQAAQVALDLGSVDVQQVSGVVEDEAAARDAPAGPTRLTLALEHHGIEADLAEALGSDQAGEPATNDDGGAQADSMGTRASHARTTTMKSPTTPQRMSVRRGSSTMMTRPRAPSTTPAA